MRRYAIQRILLAVPTFIGITILISGTLRFIPGDAVDQLAAGANVSAAGKQAIRHQLGLDRPWERQYFSWMAGTLRGDFGRSIVSGRPILRELERRLPVTAEMTVLAMAFGLLFSLPIGVLAAVKQDTPLDYLGRSIAIAAIAVPNFLLGALALALPAAWWHWSPPLHYQSFFHSPHDHLLLMLPPAIVLGVGLSGVSMRLTRTAMLETMREDFVRTARAKGLAGRIVIIRHAFRVACLPVLTLVGLQIPFLIGGAVIVEQIFNVPGMGSYLLSSLNQRDYQAVQAVDVVIGLAVIGVNLAVDLLYGALDPRLSV